IARADKDDHHHPQGVNARLHHQNARIEQGEKSGSLTNREAERLEARDARLHRQEARLRRSGDKLTVAERERLQREENRNSRAIYHQKHDKQHVH
nr:hypothetical protein [Armatimonadota bacterium]